MFFKKCDKSSVLVPKLMITNKNKCRTFILGSSTSPTNFSKCMILKELKNATVGLVSHFIFKRSDTE